MSSLPSYVTDAQGRLPSVYEKAASPVDQAPARGKTFWAAGAIALLLSSLSWGKFALVSLIDRRVLHVAEGASAGWWVYLAFRVPVTIALVWLIAGFPRRTAPAATHPARVKRSVVRLFDPLLGLRAFACFFVLMGHFFFVVFPYAPTARDHMLAPFLRTSPWAGVWIFFTLSGFLMGKGFATGRYSLDRAGSRAFLYNRLLRIAPVYYLGLLVVSVFRYPALFVARNLWILLEVCLFDYHGTLPVPVMQALWSVSAEVQFYLLVPFLMMGLLWLRARTGRAFVWLPVLLLGVGSALRLLLLHWDEVNFSRDGYMPMLPNLDIFLFGMTLSMLGRWRLPVWVERRRGALLLAAPAVFYLLISAVTARREQLHIGSLEGVMAKTPWMCVLFAGGFILLSESGKKLQPGTGLGGRLLLAVEGMGMLTYCLYVFHSDVYLSVAGTLTGVHGVRFDLLLFPPVMLLVFAVAYGFYRYVEKPFERRKHVGRPGLLDAP